MQASDVLLWHTEISKRELFAEHSLDLAMNNAGKLLVRELPLDNFSAPFCQRQP